MSSGGIIITKDGKSVSSAADADIVYHSQWKSLKIWKEGNGVADGAGEATIAHELDFIPAFLVYDNNNWKGGNCYGLNHTSFVSSTDINIRTAASANYAYRIFANPLKGVSQLSAPQQIGVQITEPGKDIDDAKLHELSLLTGTGTMQIWQRLNIEFNAPLDDVWQETEQLHGFDFVPVWAGLAAGQAIQGSPYRIPPCITVDAGKFVQIEVVADNSKFYVRAKPFSGAEMPVGAFISLYVWIYEKLID